MSSFEENSVSILITSYNTKIIYIEDCLVSIENQITNVNIELVWINDGSDELNTNLLEIALENFKNKNKNIKVNYIKFEMNQGLPYCLNYGVVKCENEIIIRMDSDDIMLPNRIQKQFDFIINNLDCVCVGTNLQFFKVENNIKNFLDKTTHPNIITWEWFKQTRSEWFMNHPSICFRKSAVLSIGNYSTERIAFEDYELELKLLKKYGKLYNIDEVLLYYRKHSEQITNSFIFKSNEMRQKKYNFVHNIINS